MNMNGQLQNPQNSLTLNKPQITEMCQMLGFDSKQSESVQTQIAGKGIIYSTVRIKMFPMRPKKLQKVRLRYISRTEIVAGTMTIGHTL
ncbi:MAG: hypothetical protein EZS28_001836 [Streblomastix strix]|uniref:Uncharacterized protein n=1 Tax=Streblomastix strix TaxID=222440 RepID=A0A5J4X5W6_9EUKA|nr:MAG: hypothetical protein EZS28_001836 [Streblomastix strix]